MACEFPVAVKAKFMLTATYCLVYLLTLYLLTYLLYYYYYCYCCCCCCCYYYYYYLTTIFPGKPASVGSLLLLLHLFWMRIVGITVTGYLWAGSCPSCHPNVSVKAPKGTRSTNPNQWSGLILSSSTSTSDGRGKYCFFYPSYPTSVYH